MGFLNRLKTWFVPAPTTVTDTHPTVQFFRDPRRVPGYRLAVIEGVDWTLLRRVRMADPRLPVLLEEEIVQHIKEFDPDPPPNTDTPHLEALKRASLIEFIRVEVENQNA